MWGAAPGELRWLNPPPPAALAIAQELLEELGATDRGRPTALGRQLSALPLHPRLGAMLLAAPPPARRTAGLLAALLSERDIFRRDGSGTTADVAARLAVLRRNGPAPADVDRAALATVRRRAEELVRRAGRPADAQQDVDPGPLLAAAYPDRIAQARGGSRYRLRHGGGAVLADHDPLAGTAWLVAADVEGGEGGPGRADGRIRLAAALDRDDVERVGGDAIRTVVRLQWDEASDDLRAVTERTLDALVLDTSQGSARPGADTTAALVARAVDTGLGVLGWTASARALQARAGWARSALGEGWPDVSDQALAGRANDWLGDALRRPRAGPTWPASTRPAPSAPHWGHGPTSSTAWRRPPSSWPAAGGYPSTTAANSPASRRAPKTCTAPPSTRPSPVARSPSRSRSSPPPAGPSKSPPTCPLSGEDPGSRCARRWPAATPNTPGPRTPPTRSRGGANAERPCRLQHYQCSPVVPGGTAGYRRVLGPDRRSPRERSETAWHARWTRNAVSYSSACWPCERPPGVADVGSYRIALAATDDIEG